MTAYTQGLLLEVYTCLVFSWDLWMGPVGI